MPSVLASFGDAVQFILMGGTRRLGSVRVLLRRATLSFNVFHAKLVVRAKWSISRCRRVDGRIVGSGSRDLAITSVVLPWMDSPSLQVVTKQRKGEAPPNALCLERSALIHASRFALCNAALTWAKRFRYPLPEEGLSLADRRVHRIANGTPEPCVRLSGTTRLAVWGQDTVLRGTGRLAAQRGSAKPALLAPKRSPLGLASQASASRNIRHQTASLAVLNRGISRGSL
jgi:hypothetical protein